MKVSKRLRRWTFVAPATAVLLVAVGTGGWALTRTSSKSSGVSYRTTTVSTGTIRQTVAATGTIEPSDTEDLNFAAAGQVTGVYVSVGQKVAKGQRLATINSATLASALASAQATLASAQARLSTDETSSASSAQLNADQANVALANAQVANAQTALAGATLTAPIAGTVSVVNLTAEQQLGAGSGGSSGGSGGTGESGSGGSGGSGSGNGSGGQGNGSGGQGGAGGAGSGTSSTSSGSSASSAPQIEVISTGSYLVNASVDASDVGLIAKNDQAVITPNGASTNVFGLVSSVGIVATTTSGVSSFPVVITLTGSPSGLYPGTTATVAIVYRQLSNVLVVPTLAISRSGGTTTVLVPSGGTPIQRTVVTGLSSGGQTQIVSGLQDGDQIMVAVPVGNSGNSGSTGTGRSGGGGGFGGRGGGGFGGGGLGGGGFGGGGFGGGTGGAGRGTGTGPGA